MGVHYESNITIVSWKISVSSSPSFSHLYSGIVTGRLHYRCTLQNINADILAGCKVLVGFPNWVEWNPTNRIRYPNYSSSCSDHTRPYCEVWSWIVGCGMSAPATAIPNINDAESSHYSRERERWTKRGGRREVDGERWTERGGWREVDRERKFDLIDQNSIYQLIGLVLKY